MITKTAIDLLINKTNLTEVASEITELTLVGSHLKGHFPFHDYRNSFIVSADQQIWKCSKCGKGIMRSI